MKTAQAKIQKFGSLLSAMVMPNIGVFIGWGLLTALFIDTGWTPNAYLNKLVSPILPQDLIFMDDEEESLVHLQPWEQL